MDYIERPCSTMKGVTTTIIDVIIVDQDVFQKDFDTAELRMNWRADRSAVL